MTDGSSNPRSSTGNGDSCAAGVYPRSVTATIAVVAHGRTIIELDEAAWSALGLGVGDRVMVHAGDELSSGEVTEFRIVTLPFALGDEGDRVRVRRPRLETCGTAHVVRT